MIKFKLVPEPAWIKASHSDFDGTEIGHFPKEDREKLRFRIAPFTPLLMKEIEDEKEQKKVETEVTKSNTGSKEENNNKLLSRILLDWEGVLDTEDNPVSFSMDAAMKLFDGGYPTLGGVLVSVARKLTSRFDEYNAEKATGITKNS